MREQRLRQEIICPGGEQRTGVLVSRRRGSISWPEEVLELLPEDGIWLGRVHEIAHMLDRASFNEIQMKSQLVVLKIN